MAKNKRKRTKTINQEPDTAYFLKIVLYIIIGAQWVRITDNGGSGTFPIPAGLIIGVLFAAHEHFQMDRKIEYALLIVAALVGFWSQAGIYINL